MQQRTIASSIKQTGTGLHSGIITNVCIVPAKPGSGRYFV
ncbi:MAG: UDP-3-O-acyl-N-acetylglucosamine deacetylase, partial [Cyanobacteria bacterium J06643_5]